MTKEPFRSRKVPVSEGAEAFIELLNANGVDYIFLSPGSDLVAIQEAIAKFKSRGKRTPEVILSLDESVGMAAAHGYFMISGRPQVVLVHVDLGIQQVGGALHNAQRDRIGVILCAGRAPLVFEDDKAYGRKAWPQWMTEKYDQASIVRDYVKWDYELRSNENIHLVIQRAFQITSTEPCGPVYLTLPPELLMEKIDSVLIPDVARYKPPATPQADDSMLAKAAEILIQAENPIIITGYSGRHTQSVASLVELAETLSARVINFPYRMSFPTTHPLWCGIDPNPYLDKADVVLVVDHDVPYLPTQARLQPEAKVIHIDIDPVKKDMPSWIFPVDLLIEADSSKAIPSLTEIIRQKVDPQQKARFQTRFQQIRKENQILRRNWRQSALSQAKQKPISAEWLCHCVSEVIGEQDILLTEIPTGSPPVARQIPRSEPGTAFDKAGSSLGWGLGAALGAKLAAPDKTVVLLVGDGSFVYGCPTAALWASQVYNIPFLCIIFCDKVYSGVKRSLRRCYGDSVSEKEDKWVGTDIAPSPEYSLIAQACGVDGQRIDNPDELLSALRSAYNQVCKGKSVVLDVRTSENP